MAKINLSDINIELVHYSWVLLSTEYKNLDTELEMICPEGHKVYLSLKQWRRKKECPVCAQNQFKQVAEVTSSPKQSGKKRVLALDNSTTITGWAVFDDLELVGYGKIKMTQGDTMARINGMNEWMLSMIAKWKPDVVAIEDIQQQQNVQLFKVLAWFQGVLLHTLFCGQKEYLVIHVATWRSGCGIKGRTRAELKKAAQEMVKKWYEISVTEDEADAICLGRHAITKELKNNDFNGFGNL